MSSWSTGLFSVTNPVTFLITCCCPCVQYGLNATAVHGGSCPMHGVQCCLGACCGVHPYFTGATRRALRTAYNLPQVPNGLSESDPSDFLVHLVGIVSLFALCQEANEIAARSVSSPLAPEPNPFVPLTSAPKQEAMA